MGILDADVYGPSLPMMTGLKGSPQVNKRILQTNSFTFVSDCVFFIRKNDAAFSELWCQMYVNGVSC